MCMCGPEEEHGLPGLVRQAPLAKASLCMVHGGPSGSWLADAGVLRERHRPLHKAEPSL